MKLKKIQSPNILYPAGLILLFLLISLFAFSAGFKGSPYLYSGFEISGALIALIGGAACIAFFLGTKSRYYLLAGLALFFAGGIDIISGITTISTFRREFPVYDFHYINYSSIISRIVFASAFTISPLLEHYKGKSILSDRRARLHAVSALILAIGIMLISTLISSRKQDHSKILNTAEIISAFLFISAGLAVYRRFIAEKDIFSMMLFCSMLVSLIGQIYILLSGELFDSCFTTGQFAKVLSYITPLFGVSMLGLEERRRADEELRLRRKAESELRRRIELEELVTNISTAFIFLKLEQVDEQINYTLRQTAEFIRAGRSYVFTVSDEDDRMESRYEWCAKDAVHRLEELRGLPLKLFPWWIETLRRFQNLYIPDVNNLPPSMREERETLASLGIKSFCVVPLVLHSELKGFMGFDWFDRMDTLDDETIRQLKMMGDIIISALRRKRSETDIRRLSSVVRNTAAGVVLTDMKGVIEYVNPGFLALGEFEYESEIIGKSIFRLSDNEGSVRLREEVIPRLLSKGRWVGEILLQKRNGQFFPASMICSLITNSEGIPQQFLAIYYDLSDRKIAEAALKQSEESLRSLLNSMDDLVFVVKDDGIIQHYFQPEHTQSTKGGHRKYIGRRYDDVFPANVAEALGRIIRSMKVTGETERFEYYLEYEDRTQWYSATVSPMRDQTGGFAGVTTVARDITQRKLAELELARAREQEINIGASIQRNLLHGKPPVDIHGLEIAVLTIPSQKIDGDFYDFFNYEENHLDIVIGDVMGKGIPAALLGAGTKSQFLRTISQLFYETQDSDYPSPEKIVNHLHSQVIHQLIDLESFITIIYARFDIKRRKVEFVDCGHTRSMHFRRDPLKCEPLEGVNMPLGFSEFEAYKQAEAFFNIGDIFLFYSDGVTETQNMNGELFGEDRLKKLITDNIDAEPEELIDLVKETVMRFSGTAAFNDDFTCLTVKIDQSIDQKPLKQSRRSFDSSLDDLSAIRVFVRDSCMVEQTFSPDDESLYELETAVNETASNIIIHAYDNTPGRPIEVEVDRYSKWADIRFKHVGKRFNPDSVRPPAFDGSRSEGFGLFLVKSCVDKVRYHFGGQGGNTIFMRKSFHK